MTTRLPARSNPEVTGVTRHCLFFNQPVRAHSDKAHEMCRATTVTGKVALRVKSNLLNGFNLIWAVQLSSQIYTSSLSPQISGYFRASCFDKRGVSRSSRTRGGMRWTRARRRGSGCRAGQTRERFTSRRMSGAIAYGKTVWSWHPWLVSSWRRLTEPNRVRSAVNSPAMEARRIRLQGERGISRKAIAQGK